jgi:ABC-type dipeptide/oligopeptide/nickel transport system permease subunit
LGVAQRLLLTYGEMISKSRFTFTWVAWSLKIFPGLAFLAMLPALFFLYEILRVLRPGKH